MYALFRKMSHSRWYWLGLLLFGLCFIAIALYYQYVLDELPCVLCIHTRIWISAISLLALLAVLIRQRWFNISAHALTVVCSAGLLERSYQLLGTERGFIFGDCGFDLGLPSWFALDQWLPAVYGVETTCGYTPELLFGISMAEVLTVLSSALLLTSLVMTIAALVRQQH